MPEEDGVKTDPRASGAMSDSENEYGDADQHTRDEDEKMVDQSVASEAADGSGEVKKKYDPKDPLRPRRKKARRACFACQRAHLTCGKPLHPFCQAGSARRRCPRPFHFQALDLRPSAEPS